MRRGQGFLITFLAGIALSAMAQEPAPAPPPVQDPAPAPAPAPAPEGTTPAPGDAPTEGQLRNDILRARINTLYGPAGLIIVPHAYVATQRRLVVGTYIARDVSASANYGILKGIDVGAAYVNPHDEDGEVLANAKINIVPSNFGKFELGIGTIDLLDMLDQTFYLMASWELVTPDVLKRNVRGLRVHLGYGTGLFDDSIIGGGEFLLNRRLAIIGEYDGNRLNAALRYVRDEGFRMQLGLASSRLFFSTAYAFAP